MQRNTTPACCTENDIFASQLRKTMEEKKETQTSLAEKTGLQRQTISLYVNGQSKPDTARLTLIAKALDVSADWLLGLTNIQTVDSEIRRVCEYTGLSEKAVQSICSLGRGYPVCYGGVVLSQNEALSQLLESNLLPKFLSNIAASVYDKNLDSSLFLFKEGVRLVLGDKGSLLTDLPIKDLTSILYPLSSYIGVVPLDKEEAAELDLSMACDTLKEIVRGMKRAVIKELEE